MRRLEQALLASGNYQHGRHLFKYGNRAGIFLASILLKEMRYLVYKISMIHTVGNAQQLFTIIYLNFILLVVDTLPSYMH
jgi:hypothetical protein